jgi:hypothetical protein
VNQKLPSPWGIVNDYSKTVVATAAAFLAFTATFSSQFIGRTQDQWLYWCLIGAWLLLVAAIGASFFTFGRLTGFLRKPGSDERKFLFPANVSFFCLLAATALFFVAAIRTVGTDPKEEASVAREVAESFLAEVDSDSFGQTELALVEWNGVAAEWNLMFASNTDTAWVAVEARRMVVSQFRRN